MVKGMPNLFAISHPVVTIHSPKALSGLTPAAELRP
jgi:hypothetical protein